MPQPFSHFHATSSICFHVTCQAKQNKQFNCHDKIQSLPHTLSPIPAYTTKEPPAHSRRQHSTGGSIVIQCSIHKEKWLNCVDILLRCCLVCVSWCVPTSVDCVTLARKCCSTVRNIHKTLSHSHSLWLQTRSYPSHRLWWWDMGVGERAA